MKFLLATKQKMTQVFDENGVVTPATILSAGPIVVTQIKNKESDGYFALQVGYEKGTEKKTTKAIKGHLGKLGLFKYLREFRLDKAKKMDHKIGDTFDVSTFEEGDKITVSGISKGKGFQGVVKRHGFHGGPRSHGQKHSEREPGSIGATGPQRVFKGVKMGGRMGSNRVSVKGLKVLVIDKENNQLIVSGAVPGKRGTLVEIRG